jgi:MFS family permease
VIPVRAGIRWNQWRTFRSLSHRDFRFYFSGQVISFVGSWMQSTALMWLVYDLTSDALWPAMMLVASVGPTLILGPLAGWLADRVPKRFLVITTQSLFLMTAVVLSVVVGCFEANPILLLTIQIINGLIQAMDLPARLSFVPDLIPKVDLINAVSLNAMAFNSARFIGPACTGLIYGLINSPRSAALGATICFVINAVSYGVVILALCQIHAGGRGTQPKANPALGAGLRFLIENRSLGLLVILTGLLCVFTWPVLTLMPAFTKTVVGLQEKAFSLFVSSLGAGACVAAGVTATFGSVGRRRVLLSAGSVIGSLGVLGLAFVAQPMFVAVFCAMLGFGLITYLSTGQSTMQLRSPDAIRGRVMAYWAMTLSASAPIGHLLAGSAAQYWPVSSVLLVMGIGGLVTASLIAVLCLKTNAEFEPRKNEIDVPDPTELVT